VTVTYAVNPLKRNELLCKVASMENLNDRVRERLRVEKDRRKISERDIADLIGWNQSRVSQKLTGRTPITVEELGTLCFALGLSPVEAMRDPGMEFVSEMTPTELKIHEKIRTLTPDQRAAMLTMLHIAQPDARRALPPKKTIKIRA
jgi:transcriptional regulator with XRE-family HTH domain